MPERKFDVGNQYRYGFNSQEHDRELNENITTALFWEYDGRIGRRWNVDPYFYPYNSPYQCFDNNPINNTDPDGKYARIKNKEQQNIFLEEMKKLGLEGAFRFNRRGMLKVNRSWEKNNAGKLSESNSLSEIYQGFKELANNRMYKQNITIITGGEYHRAFTLPIKANMMLTNNLNNKGSIPVSDGMGKTTYHWSDPLPDKIKMRVNGTISGATSVYLDLEKRNKSAIFLYDADTHTEYKRGYLDEQGKPYAYATTTTSLVHYLLDRANILGQNEKSPVYYENMARTILNLPLRSGTDVQNEDKFDLRYNSTNTLGKPPF